MNKKIIYTIAGLALTGTITSAFFMTSADYTATSDPLITLSYVNETLVPQIEESVTNKVLEELGNTSVQQPTEPEEPVDMTEYKYTVVHLLRGQKLFAMGESTESCELVLRSGEAVSVSPFSDQGIADLTASKQLYNGDSLVKNNYCIIPRGQDGRGVEIKSDEAYLLVRGVYEVE